MNQSNFTDYFSENQLVHQWKIYFTGSSVKNIFHWFGQWKLTDLKLKIFFHWWISEKANHWFNQWKFDWLEFIEYDSKFKEFENSHF